MAMATMIYFDTLQYVKTLEASGVVPKQAEAMAKAQQEVLSECLNTTLATKQDITELKNHLENQMAPMKADIATLKSEVKWIQWVLGFVAAGVGTLILKAFF